METNTPTSSNSVVKPIALMSKKPMMIAMAIVVILVGLGIGWLVSGSKVANNPLSKGSSISVSPTEAGIKDPSTIKDVTTATGTLKVGGIKGEGMYHLERPGGATKTVYLTSTTVNMSTFVDKKVQVWGLTLAAKYAPWFMDVAKIKVVE